MAIDKEPQIRPSGIYLARDYRPLTPEQAAFEDRVTRGFAGLRGIPSTHPHVVFLNDYARTVPAKLASLRQPAGLSEEAARRLMSQIPPSDREAVCRGAMVRLQQETGYLEELRDTGVDQVLTEGLTDARLGASVLLTQKDSAISRVIFKEDDGLYLSAFNAAIINGLLPGPEEMMVSLVSKGTLPRIISVLDHELTHDGQFTTAQQAALLGSFASLFVVPVAALSHFGFWTAAGVSAASQHIAGKITEALDNDTMVGELHASEAAAASASFGEPEIDEMYEIAAHVIGGYGLERSLLGVSRQTLSALRLLRISGKTDLEIGKVISGDRLDPSGRKYVRLSEAVNELMGPWGITDERTFAAVTSALFARFDLERMLTRHQAQRIVTEELRREAGASGWTNPEL